MNIKVVAIDKPEDMNMILGQAQVTGTNQFVQDRLYDHMVEALGAGVSEHEGGLHT